MTLALTAAGLQIETFEEIVANISAKLTKRFGNIDLSENSIEGVLVAIIAERLASGDKLLQRIYSSWDPDAASGSALASLSSLTGTLREGATKTAVTLTLLGVDGTPVLSLNRVRNPSSINGDQFETSADGTITAIAAWAPSTAYALNDRKTNGGNAYLVITAGVSAGSGGPTTTASDIADGTVHWRYIGAGTALVDVPARALVEGPITAAAGSLTERVTPVAGWNGVVNLYDASPGRYVMSDGVLRRKRVIDLQQPGTGPIDAIRAALSDPKVVPGVNTDTVRVWHNVTKLTVDGIPPNSVEVLLEGGDDQVIANALLANVVGGIRTHGNTLAYATDSQGTSHERKFSRPELLDIYVIITLVKDPAEYPNDGDELVKQAIVQWGAAQKAGKNVVASAIGAAAFDVLGVLNVPSPPLISAAPTTVPIASTEIEISKRQRAVFDTSRITVITTDGEP